MAHTYEELKKKTVAELRQLAGELDHEAVQGYTQLNELRASAKRAMRMH